MDSKLRDGCMGVSGMLLTHLRVLSSGTLDFEIVLVSHLHSLSH